jgi:chorismate mutase
LFVRAIRGATTVVNNDSKEILDNTQELLNEILIENDLKVDDVISIVFSLTKDLNAAFPAVAARKMGWSDVALMCTNEIDVPGSLEKCVRVLLHINTNKSNREMKHVYLRDAKVLRPDLVEQNKV